MSVSEVMVRQTESISPETSLSDAAKRMADTGLMLIPVMDEGKLLGIISPAEVMAHVCRSFDPLTELAWSDGLREWLSNQLKASREVSILFVDLDGFGQFNKQFGHIVGDEVLRTVARILESSVDSERDYLCRYGGDEFCIGTLRPMSEAELLADQLAVRVAESRVAEAGDMRVHCTVGISGGKRTKEREDTHFASTVNNLINAASRESMTRKAEKLGQNLQELETAVVQHVPGRLRLAEVVVNWTDRNADVRVEIEAATPIAYSGNGKESGPVKKFSTTSSVETDEAGVLRVVAEATASTLRPILPDGHLLSLSDVLLNQTSDGKQIITAVGQYAMRNRVWAVAGSSVVTDNRYRSAAAAVLAGVNRLITRPSLDLPEATPKESPRKK
jgi:diguanylate cyclase (GGDEF)-like protein